ncbi:PEN family class A beta-lactamase, Bpc-type [Kitasatospora paracochleata]|uniref:Beta-lactamase n=1 Tax=Kitasatospora paracochleata TaxID=58354 RepID=A0ABT1J0T8_9ACTN|nr:class A beta-lactamase [Kitasatospora paracochleata]MCP2311050.1 beta-lactamase class A [Kitasatospora paracochleata]
MTTNEGRMSRRAVLGMGAGTVLAVTVPTGGAARADGGAATVTALADLEREHGARLGVFARNTVTGTQVRYRAQELFPICSVHKIVTAAAVLRDLDRDGEVLARRVHYTAADVAEAGYAPITGTPEHLAGGMTIADLCAAALEYSDNAADNLLLRELGGPQAVTRFCRSLGDRVTRLDRWEPALNSAEPGRVTDTTTPAAIAGTLEHLLLGRALTPGDRRQLTRWMLANTTGAARLRAGLPSTWSLADKTGTGSYGTTNDVGLAWTPDGTPLVLAVLSTGPAPDAPADEALVARAAALVAPALH